MLNEKEASKLADLYKMFADKTRLKILSALNDATQNVNDLSLRIEMSQSATSHQLKILKDGNLVSFERKGKQIEYFLQDDHVRDILNQGINHIRHI